MIVGTTITNMMPKALSRIFASAAPIGPCGSSTPPEQPLTERKAISTAGTWQGRGRHRKKCLTPDDLESGSCMKLSASAARMAPAFISGFASTGVAESRLKLNRRYFDSSPDQSHTELDDGMAHGRRA